MGKSESLTARIRPLLSGEVSLGDITEHTRQALDIYIHFRASAIVDSGNPERIKGEIETMPEAVRQLVRDKARKLYKRKRL